MAADAELDVEFHEALEMEHVFEVISPFSSAAEQVMAQVDQFVQRILG